MRQIKAPRKMRGAKFLHKNKFFGSIGKHRKSRLELGVRGVSDYLKIHKQISAGHRLRANVGDVYTCNRKGRDITGKCTGDIGENGSYRTVQSQVQQLPPRSIKFYPFLYTLSVIVEYN